MSLDDNHNIVVLACAKAIQCVISYDMNENLFDILEVDFDVSKNVFLLLVMAMSSSSF